MQEITTKGPLPPCEVYKDFFSHSSLILIFYHQKRSFWPASCFFELTNLRWSEGQEAVAKFQGQIQPGQVTGPARPVCRGTRGKGDRIDGFGEQKILG